VERIAIVTVCLNDRAGLERTLASVFAQTNTNYELIVVDGGSTDGSVELIQRNAERIHCWTSEKDAGIYDAQNKGWYTATAPVVLFLNAGDVLAAPDVLQQAAQALSTEIDILYGDAHLSDARGVHATKVHPARITSVWLMKEVVAHQSQFIRTSLLMKLEGYDKRFRIAADYAFFARAFWERNARMRKLDRVVSIFDRSGISSSPEQKANVARERKEIQRLYAPKPWFWIYHTYAALNRMMGR